LPDAAERDAATPEGHSEASADIDAIRHEGLTGRQLRMARPVAQKNGMSVTSDFDAMRQLRLAGVDPFQRSTVLKLVASDSKSTGGTRGAWRDPRHAGYAQGPCASAANDS
jgi:capsular polysaccharide transport system permease protein